MGTKKFFLGLNSKLLRLSEAATVASSSDSLERSIGIKTRVANHLFGKMPVISTYPTPKSHKIKAYSLLH